MICCRADSSTWPFPQAHRGNTQRSIPGQICLSGTFPCTRAENLKNLARLKGVPADAERQAPPWFVVLGGPFTDRATESCSLPSLAGDQNHNAITRLHRELASTTRHRFGCSRIMASKMNIITSYMRPRNPNTSGRNNRREESWASWHAPTQNSSASRLATERKRHIIGNTLKISTTIPAGDLFKRLKSSSTWFGSSEPTMASYEKTWYIIWVCPSMVYPQNF